jgi:hypothetical protein
MGAPALNTLRILFAQVPTPDQVAEGVRDFGPIYLLILALFAVLGWAAYLFRTLRAKDEQIALLHESYGKQIAQMKEAHGDKVAALERASGLKVETMLSDQLGIAKETRDAMMRLATAMERPTGKG